MNDAAKNLLCPANPYPDVPADWIRCTRVSLRAQARWLADPDLSAWLERSRLNATRGTSAHLADPRMQSAMARMYANFERAITSLGTLQAQVTAHGSQHEAAVNAEYPASDVRRSV